MPDDLPPGVYPNFDVDDVGMVARAILDKGQPGQSRVQFGTCLAVQYDPGRIPFASVHVDGSPATRPLTLPILVAGVQAGTRVAILWDPPHQGYVFSTIDNTEPAEEGATQPLTATLHGNPVIGTDVDDPLSADSWRSAPGIDAYVIAPDRTFEIIQDCELIVLYKATWARPAETGLMHAYVQAGPVGSLSTIIDVGPWDTSVGASPTIQIPGWDPHIFVDGDVIVPHLWHTIGETINAEWTLTVLLVEPTVDHPFEGA